MAKNPRKGGSNRTVVQRPSTSASVSPTPEEGVRLVRAFTRIEDGDLREALIKLVEALAQSKSP
jgi:uncharacterized membrane protein